MANDNKLTFQVSDAVASGSYSNFAVISHTHSEFVVDFAQIYPGNDDIARVCSRIVMAPEHAKRFLDALIDNIGKYESHFGPIDTGSGPQATLNVANLLQGKGNRS